MSYDILLHETRLIATKYSLDNMLKGFTPDLLNLLAKNHIDKLQQADDFEKTVLLINNALASQFGAAVAIGDFVTDISDRHKLYSLFAQWRAKLLAELGIQN